MKTKYTESPRIHSFIHFFVQLDFGVSELHLSEFLNDRILFLQIGVYFYIKDAV